MAAALGAIVVLLFGALISVGTVLAAPVGTWLASRYLGQGRGLGLGGRWMASTVSVSLVLALVAALAWASLPAGSARRIRQVSDSAAAAAPKRPPPAWVERLAPGSTAAANRKSGVPAGLASAFAVWGVAMGVVILAALYGTVGWLGSLLLTFAHRGRWPTASATAPPTGGMDAAG